LAAQLASGLIAPEVAVPTFELVAVDWQTPLGLIEGYERATIAARFNAVSSWEIVLPTSGKGAQLLLNAARPRVVVRVRGGVFRSGPVTRVERTADLDGDFVTLTGADDLVWLQRRLAHPTPALPAPPYNTQAYDAQIGAASTVIAGYVNRNLGPAAVPARQLAGFTVPPPPAFGGTISVQARYDNLLDFVARIANAAGVGIAAPDLTFQVFQPSGEAVFSVELGTLAGWTTTLEAPDANYVYVAGQGEAQARTIREYQDGQSYLDWGRVETFQDRRDTNDPAQLDQAGAEALVAGVKAPTVDMQALDTPAQEFLTDWNLGDIATAYVGGQQIRQIVAEVDIELEGNAPARITPVLGGPVIPPDDAPTP
jgi:hypothetical protein